MDSIFYLYGIIKSDTPNPTMPNGLFGQTVLTFVAEDNDTLAILASPYPENQPETVINSRENLLMHQKTIEAIFEQQTVLPIKFGTLMTERTILAFLKNHADSLLQSLHNFSDKAEMVFKGFWKDIPSIFNDIAQNNEKIHNFKQQIDSGQIPATQNNLIEIGKMVEDALQSKKDDLKNTILEKLIPLSIQVKENTLLTESMFMNIVFLIQKSQERSFDAAVQIITDELEHNTKFQYFGPAAPANFIDLKFED